MKADRQEIFKYAGWLGAALLVGGYLRYLVREEMGNFDKGLLIAGAALLVLSLALNFRELIALFSRRGTKLGTNTAVLTVAVLVIIGIVNFLGYRYHKRFDLTSEGLYSLSDQTRKVVSGLTQEVKIIKFDKTEDAALRDTMQEFRNLSSKLSYERIDPQEKPQLAREYEVRSFGETIVASGNRIERPTATTEQELVNAILKVTRDKLKSICFVENHGEKSISATGPDGISAVSEGLKDQNYETRTVALTDEAVSPCDVVVVAGPRTSLFEPEAQALTRYLDNGGKVLLMFEPETDPGLGNLLSTWNISLGNDLIWVRNTGGQLAGLGPNAPLVRYGTHPITKDMAAVSIMNGARSVRVADPARTDVSTTELLNTLDSAWGETDKGEAEFDPEKDLKGPVTVGIAATKKVGEKEARLVVTGDVDFATNGLVRNGANGNLILNTFNWLAQDEDLISIRPKSATSRQINLTESQKNLIWLLTVIFLPAMVVLTGGYVWWRRR